MSARDKFIDVLRSRGMLRPGEEWVVDANLAAYAHELAELIRSTPGPDDPDDYGGFVSMGADWAADLIDPKAQRASTEGDKP